MFLQEFLSIKDQKAFAKVLKERDREKKFPARLTDFFTERGEGKVAST